MKKFIILLITLFCFSSCATLHQQSYSSIVYVKVFQKLGPKSALCYQCHYDEVQREYVRSNNEIIKLVTSQFTPHNFGIYALKETHIKMESTYTYETESGKLRTVPIWEYYY